jgi:3-methyl-2-oxobutanoate hydroxymethyltransferase
MKTLLPTSWRIPPGRRIVALTAYSYPFARLLDESGVDLVLVGDSAGMVEHGRPDTTTVTLAEMLHHTRSARAGVRVATLVADLPFGTYTHPAEAVEHAAQLRQAGADAVKLEGGCEVLPQIEAVLRAGIPVVGHLGMLPQRIREEGKYRVKGRQKDEAERLRRDALALAEAGVFALVLELVTPDLAREITASCPIPTIGIGSGPSCAGQILVTYDLLGLTPWFKPGFVQPQANLGEEVRRAVRAFAREVRGENSTQRL